MFESFHSGLSERLYKTDDDDDIVFRMWKCVNDTAHVRVVDSKKRFQSWCSSQDVHSHKALALSHLPPVTHTKHAGRHGFHGDQEAPFLDNGSECVDGGH